MRSLFFASLLLVGCAPPDYLPGSYNFTMASTDTESAPRMQTNTSSGMGTMAINVGKSVDYVVTIAQSDASPCVVEATANEKGDVISITPDQKCTFTYAGGSVTATMTTGTIKSTGDKGEGATVEVNYTYAGTTLGINFAGTGKRTYTGTRR